MNHSGIALKKIREYLNINQVDFAKELGVSKQYLCNIENGTKGLSKNKILFLQEKYNINPNYLLTGNGEMFQPTCSEIEAVETHADSIIGEFMTEKEIERLAECLENSTNKSLLFLCIEKILTDQQGIKRFLLEN